MSAFISEAISPLNDEDFAEIYQPFRLNTTAQSLPSCFEITFNTAGYSCTYAFSVSQYRVHSENLRVDLENSHTETYGFERNWDEGTKQYVCNFRGILQQDIDLFRRIENKNCLLLAAGSQEEIQSLVVLHNYLTDTIRVSDMSNSMNILYSIAIDDYEDDENLHKNVLSLMRDADFNIEDMIVTPEQPNNLSASENYQNSLTQAYQRKKVTILRRGTTDSLSEFDFASEESIGTQRFFALAVELLNALTDGAFVAIDELDASMHPNLTHKLLELFQSPDANPNGAQLLFTTHDSSLLSHDLFRRDQIWLAEKQGGASVFYSLADVKPPPRNTESFLRNYLSGRYGGTPYLGGAFQSLELDAAK